MITKTASINITIRTPPILFSVCLPAAVVDEADVTFNNIVPVDNTGISVERLQYLFQECLLLYHNFYLIFIMNEFFD